MGRMAGTRYRQPEPVVDSRVVSRLDRENTERGTTRVTTFTPVMPRTFGIAKGSRVQLRYAGHVGTVVKIASNHEDINVVWDTDPFRKGEAGMWHFVSALELM